MKTLEIVELSSTAFDAADEADMTVVIGGKLTGWVWTFAGPGHPQTIAQSNRLSRERLQADRVKEAAQVNGKKWKAPDETVDEVRDRNIAWVVERIVGWSPIRIDGDVLEFSPEAARKLLSDVRKVELLSQSLEFLASDTAFTQRSAKA